MTRIDLRPHVDSVPRAPMVFGGTGVHAIAEDGRRTIAYCGKALVRAPKTRRRVNCKWCLRELRRLGHAG